MSAAMTPVLILTGALIVTGGLLYLHNRFWYKRRDNADSQSDAGDSDASDDSAEEAARPDGCCGMHEVCEKAADAIADNNFYYDDEELDEYKGRDADSYTEAEVDRFREVLFTLRRDELLAWEAALRERQVAMPSQLRDEFLLLLS